VIGRAVEAGIARILVPGYDLVSSRAAVALAAAHPELIDAAVGVHPHFSAAPSPAEWDELATLAAEPLVVAVGEIGLDFHRDLSPPAAQRAALERQLAIAALVGKPVLVHDRDAHDEVRAALLGWNGPGAGRLQVQAGQLGAEQQRRPIVGDHEIGRRAQPGNPALPDPALPDKRLQSNFSGILAIDKKLFPILESAS